MSSVPTSGRGLAVTPPGMRRGVLWRLSGSIVARGCFGVLALLLIGEALTASGALGPYVPRPSAVVRGAVDLAGTTRFWEAAFGSLKIWALSVVLSIVIGVSLGTLVAYSKRSYRAGLLLIEFLRPIPPAVLIPPAILLLGLGTSMQVGVSTFGGTWIVLILTMYGVRGVDSLAINSARTLQLSRFDVLFRVIIRSALPSIMSSVRIVAGTGFVLVLATELLGATTGIGALVRFEQGAGHDNTVYGAVLLSALMGLLMNVLLARAEHKLCFWSRTDRSGN